MCSLLKWSAFVGLVAASSTLVQADSPKTIESVFTVTEGTNTLNFEVWAQQTMSYLKTEDKFSGDLYNGFTDTKIDPKLDFSVRRVRLGVYGNALFPWLSYKMTADFGTKDGVILKDAYVKTAFGDWNAWYFGQFKAPFDMFELYSDTAQMFPDRPITSAFGPKRDQGVMWAGHSKDKRFGVWAAAMNGNGSNQSGNDNDKELFAVRFAYMNEGGFANSATAADHPDGLQWQVGGAYLSNPRGGLGGDTENEGCNIGFSSKCRYYTKDQRAIEIFGALRGARWQANASVQKWKYEDGRFNENASLADLEMTSWAVEGGFFVTDRDEIVGRAAKWKYDDTQFENFDRGSTSNAFGFDNDVKEYGLGWNHYFAAHNFKLHAGYRRTQDNQDLNDFGTKGSDEITEDGFVAQLQFKL